MTFSPALNPLASITDTTKSVATDGTLEGTMSALQMQGYVQAALQALAIVTAASNDYALVTDTSAAGVLKRALVSDFGGGGGGGAEPAPAMISGNWVMAHNRPGATAGGANGNGTMRLVPFFRRVPITVHQLGARVTTSAASGNFQLAVYAHNAATGLPTGTVLGNTGNMSTTSAATIGAALAGTDFTLAAGVYWAAINCDNATAAFSSTPNTGSDFASLIGSATLGNMLGSSIMVTSRFLSQTFGTWPDLTSASSTESTSNTNIALALQAA